MRFLLKHCSFGSKHFYTHIYANIEICIVVTFLYQNFYFTYLFTLYLQHFKRISKSTTGLGALYRAGLIPLVPPIFSMSWKNGIQNNKTDVTYSHTDNGNYYTVL